MWFIIGLILFFITLYVHKHTYTVDYRGNINKTVTPVWAVILAIVVSMIPIINIILFIVGLVAYIVNYAWGDIYLTPAGVIKKLFDFLNKEV